MTMYLDIIITTTDNDNTDVQSPRLFVMHARMLSELSPYHCVCVCVVRAVYIKRLTNRQRWRARGLSFSPTHSFSFSLSLSFTLVYAHTPRTYTLSLLHTHTRAPIFLYPLCARPNSCVKVLVTIASSDLLKYIRTHTHTRRI